MNGVYLRYLVDDLRVVKDVGVFQKGTVAFVPRHLAVPLIASGDFEAVTTGPLARVFVVRIGQDTLPSAEVAPPTGVEPEGPTDLELEREEEERRLAVAAPTDDSKVRIDGSDAQARGRGRDPRPAETQPQAPSPQSESPARGVAKSPQSTRPRSRHRTITVTANALAEPVGVKFAVQHERGALLAEKRSGR